MDALEELLKAVGAVVLAGGGLSLIVYQIFKHLAAKWLDARFSERLQTLKHGHDQELEGLRFKIAALLDRSVKLHQKEFEVLPEAWSLLNDAYWNVKSFVSALQSYPDIDRMSEAHQEEFIAGTPLTEWQKEELRSAPDKTATYQKQIFWHKLHDAESISRRAYVYLVKNGIFIKHEIRSKLSAIHDIVWNALIEHKVNEEHDVVPRDRRQIARLNDEGDRFMKELEVDIHNRLWPESDASVAPGAPTASA